MSICVASLLSEGAHEGNERLDLLRRELVLEGGHLLLSQTLGDRVDDLLVGRVLLELRLGEVLGLQLPAFLRLRLAVAAVTLGAALLEDLLRSAHPGHRGRTWHGGLREKNEGERDHMISCERRSARSTSSRRASRACWGPAISASPASESASCSRWKRAGSSGPGSGNVWPVSRTERIRSTRKVRSAPRPTSCPITYQTPP